LGAIAVWTSVLTALLLVGWLVSAGSPRGRRRWRRVMVRRWARDSAWLLGMQRRTSGEPSAGPALLVTNHLSYLDVVLLAAELPALFVAKREVRGWPGLGPLAALVGTIFVDRESPRDLVRVSGAIGQALEDGDTVVLFAEGTSTRGDRVLPLKSALLEPAARGGWPVRFATLSYVTPAGQPAADLALCWWGDMTFLPHLVGVAGLSRFTGSVAFGAEPVQADNRKTLAAALHAALEKDFTPVGAQA
jgi:1-acyl-sn-glycerol-3-phosphate acyltransferase